MKKRAVVSGCGGVVFLAAGFAFVCGVWLVTGLLHVLGGVGTHQSVAPVPARVIMAEIIRFVPVFLPLLLFGLSLLLARAARFAVAAAVVAFLTFAVCLPASYEMGVRSYEHVRAEQALVSETLRKTRASYEKTDARSERDADLVMAKMMRSSQQTMWFIILVPFAGWIGFPLWLALLYFSRPLGPSSEFFASRKPDLFQ